MTAKEMKVMASRDFSEVSAVDKIIYMFNDETFTAFTAQLCKEQRHECQTEYNKRSIRRAGDFYIHVEDILNAPMPEL